MLKQIAALSLSLAMAAGAVADEKPYKEGPVTSVAWVRVKDGKMYEYINYLKGNYAQEMEAFKKAGLVTGYKIYQVTPRRPEDPNLILTVTYPNYAALDHNADFDAVTTKLEGSLKQAQEGFGSRESIRVILGSELIQELIPK
jgi:dihydrofolate reductase